MKYELINFCEIDKDAVKSYMAIHNEPESKNLGDVNFIDETKIAPFNFMVGGTPCQDFSIGGARKGAVWRCNTCGKEYNPLIVKSKQRAFCPECKGINISKTRSSLLVEWLRIFEYIKPDAAIYENVKNILCASFKEMFDLFVEELEDCGYNVYYTTLNAKNFKIPQNRERLYMVIIKKKLDNGKFEFPKASSQLSKLDDFLLPVNEDNFYSLDNVDVKIDKRIKPSVRKIYERDIDLIILSQKEMFQCKCSSGFQDCKVGITLAPTLRAGNPHTAVLYNHHIRKIMPLENVRLMGFSDEDYYKMKSVKVSDAQIYKQTGNSVVVNVLVSIYENLYNAMPYLFENVRLGSFFSGIGAFEKAMQILFKKQRGEVNDGLQIY